MSASGNFVALVGYTVVGTATGVIAGSIVLTSIFTPLSLPYALGVATPFGLVTALCVYRALKI